MHSFYEVPIVPNNLRRDETIVQIADALKFLSEVTNDVFKRINERIELNKKKVSNIGERVEVARAKISKLSGAKKATQIFSSCKYPAADVCNQYSTVFSGPRLTFNKTKTKLKDLQFKEKPLENLQFYHVKVDRDSRVETTDGLGEVPEDIDLFDNLLLYNTGKNLYQKYVISDPLQVAQVIKKDEVSNNKEIGAAPHSLSDRSMNKSASETYFYSPDLGEVPTFDVPLDLPDLPGIADDLRYTSDFGITIAPSVSSTPIIPDLPTLDDSTILDTVPTEPPPPPPRIDPPPVIEEIKNEPIHTVQPVISPPPPPPPPPMKEELPAIEKPPTITLDAHASLMAAIRNVGGSKNAKLRTTQLKKEESKPAVSGGDLMADLHAKLSMRRKGISGAKNQDKPNFDGSSAMGKISAMIPPPPAAGDQSESTNTEDDDWD